MSKIVVIGIDALDPGLIERWKDSLPNFSRIIAEGIFRRLESTMPPDSIPAWVTIYTGMQPWQHGIVDSVDYLEIRGGAKALDTKILIGRTFWDLASKAGKRVCVINPLLAYPVWNVNGIMVNGPVFITGEVQAFPPEILARYKLPELGGMVDFPKKTELQDFIQKTEKSTLDLADFGLKLFDLEAWDVYFLCFLTLDRVMHFLWRYTDPCDPTYPGPNPYEGKIKHFFEIFDSIVGRFMDSLSDGQSLMIISDHGHGMRPPNALFLNEVLRREGLLKPRSTGPLGSTSVAITEWAKHTFLQVMQRLDLEDFVYRLASVIPKKKRKQLKTSAYAIDRNSSLAWVSDVGGGTSFGGIEINRELLALKGIDYEQFRTHLIGILDRIRGESGRKLVVWARRREEAFSGPNVDKYPDVVFQLAPTYGIDRTLFCGITGRSTTHKKVSGGHTQHGVLMLYKSGLHLADGDIHITSVFDLILNSLDLKTEGTL